MAKLKEKFLNSKFVLRYRGDYDFRTVFNTSVSSAITLAIATYDFVMALLVGCDIWLITISVYYYALVLARIAILISHRVGVKRRGGIDARYGARNFLFGGALIVLLTLAFSGIIVLVTVEGRHFEYPGLMIYAMAAYAFWKITVSIVNGIRYRKYNDLTIQTLRNFNIADGIVSIIALQSALLYAFSAEEEVSFVYMMNAAMGGVAGIVMLVLGTFMIIRGKSELSRLRREKNSSAE